MIDPNDAVLSPRGLTKTDDSEHPLTRASLPVSTIDEAIPHLRRPFSPEATKWKTQAVLGAEVLIVAHIDARLVIERLNAVVGGAWHEEYVAHGRMLGCRLRVFDQEHYDVGQGQDEKAQLSDALKRVAVRFGVGVSVYALPQVRWSKLDMQSKGLLKVYTRNTPKGPKEVAELTLAGIRHLAGWAPGAKDDEDPGSGYTLWLLKTGIHRFGPVLDHGDVFDAGGIEALQPVATEPEGEEPSQPKPEQVEGEQADVLRERARKAYDRLKAKDPKAMLPAQFSAQLEAAGVSEEALAAFVIDLQDRVK